MNDETIYKLISLVEQNSVLYDKSQKLYNNCKYTEKIWNSIALNLNTMAATVLFPILNENTRVRKLVPTAKNLNVTTSFSSGLIGF